jgi:APA family basic amino acid/polyamine antiporter
MLAVLLIAAVGLVNWVGTRTCGASQVLGSAVKGLGLFLLIGVLWLFPSHAAVRSSPAISPVLGIATLATAMRAVAITYGGWNGSVYFCE